MQKCTRGTVGPWRRRKPIVIKGNTISREVLRLVLAHCHPCLAPVLLISEPVISYTLTLGGNNADFCSTTARACVNFIGGSFETAQLCADQYVDTPPVGSEPLVFEWPSQTCQPPLNGEAAGDGPDGHVCTWNLISGCTEEGRSVL